jgi:hypothetical protein
VNFTGRAITNPLHKQMFYIVQYASYLNYLKRFLVFITLSMMAIYRCFVCLISHSDSEAVAACGARKSGASTRRASQAKPLHRSHIMGQFLQQNVGAVLVAARHAGNLPSGGASCRLREALRRATPRALLRQAESTP